MLQKNPSNKLNQWKLFLIIPLLVSFVFAFNTEITAQNSQDKNTKSQEKPKTIKQSINPPIFENNKIIFDGKEFKNSLIIIDGEESTINPKNFHSNFFESIEIIKGEKATNKYGEKGKNGVVLITTKKDEPVKVIGYGKNKIDAQQSIQIIQQKTKGDNPPLIFIDGKETNKNIEDLNADNLESINIYKAEKATKKYGDKGKNGVVEITTKKK